MHFVQMADAAYWLLATADSFLAPVARAAAPVAVAALWQGSAIAAVLALCLRLAPRVSAAHRFTVWAAGFAVVFGLPFLPLLAHGAAMGNTVASRIPEPAATPWQIDARWGVAIAALWLVASAARAAGLGLHSLRLRKLWKTAKPIEDHALLASLAAMSPAKRSVEVCTTQLLDRPSVIGFFRPRILIPDWLFDRLTPAELEQVVLHETEHLRRRDDWFNLLQKVALVLFPLNLALAWMEGRLCREREMACDEGVVRRTQAPRAYAACLASLAERGLQRRELLRRAEALSLGAWQRRPELVRRVHSILRRRQAPHPLVARALVGVVGCGLALGSVELARCPQMVAFVPAVKPEAQNELPAQNESISAVYAPARVTGLAHGAAGFRAIETKAILPASQNAAVPVPVSVRRAVIEPPAAQEREIASREANANAPHESLLKAELPASDAAAASAVAPVPEAEYVVLTTWEETRISTRQDREIADYDTGRTARQQSEKAEGQSSSEPRTQITVTRLILAIYPASAANAAADNSQKASSPKAVPPAAPLDDSGWLVFQL